VTSRSLAVFDFSNRTVLITGASRGIGREVAVLFGSLGANVAVNYRQDLEGARSTVNEIELKGGRAVALRADVSTERDGALLVRQTIAEFGAVDFLVCNAGVWRGSVFEEMSAKVWDEALDVNLKGNWTVCKAVVPHMKSRHFGRIVLVSSTAGQRGESGYANYAAAKGGQISLAKSLAAELGPFNITTNCVAPGWVETEMTADALAGRTSRTEIEQSIPIGRVASALDIAWPIVFLCSEGARHINGEVLNINGGSVLCG
jgi:3-oxoacyl-[acyl-carrier protein] reductase